MPKKFFKIILLSFIFLGCAVKVEPVKKRQITELSILLQSLDMHITQKESQKLSKDIFAKREELTKVFEVTSPPQYHNFLVNVGLRKKGLCYHWSDALYSYLTAQNYTSFEFHLMGAHIGDYWREHNVLVVTAKGKAVEEGILIDPWRNPEALYFSKVSDDVKYLWVHRPNRGCK